MTTLAHGIDLVECSRIQDLLGRHGDRFICRVFTPAEIAYARSARNTVERLAGRFAAKEAVMKLIGTGWRGTIAWTDIEIVNDPMGRPQVRLSGEVARILREKGIGQVEVSITHTAQLAMASALALAHAHDGPRV
ncbi:MAG: holo-ACP synthase [Phycisphaerae bacterium]|nr:holo-ACP synthase [Phycisphaerae bacterium]